MKLNSLESGNKNLIVFYFSMTACFAMTTRKSYFTIRLVRGKSIDLITIIPYQLQ